MLSFFPSREVLLAIGSFEVRWYGVLWLAGFALAYFLLPKIQKYRDLKLTRDDWLYVILLGTLGAVVGGRLGYVLLWEPGYFLQNPGQVIAIWDGGMASHGGFVGVGLGLGYAAKKLKVDLWKLLDVIVVPAALGLALGRVGNFINAELFDPPALAWLAVGKNAVIAGVCYAILRKTPSGSPLSGGGLVLSVFLISYGILRFLVEFIRAQEFAGFAGLSRGQWYTLAILGIGLGIWLQRQKRLKRHTAS